jgi:hypothetical protein
METLLESVLYIVAVVGMALLSAVVLYKGIKQSTDFVSGDSAGLLGDQFKVTFRLGGAIAGFLVILFLMVHFVPYDKAVPSIEVWEVRGSIRAPSDVHAADIVIGIRPSPAVRDDMTYDLHVIRSRDPASGNWRFPIIVVDANSKPGTPSFDRATIDPNQEVTLGSGRTVEMKDIKLVRSE